MFERFSTLSIYGRFPHLSNFFFLPIYFLHEIKIENDINIRLFHQWLLEKVTETTKN